MRVIAAIAALAASFAVAQDFSRSEVKAQKLTERIYMLTGAGGNLGLSVGEDAVFLIDDQYAPMTDKIRAAVAAITPKPVKFVLNTHWHGDHTGGNEAFGKAGAIVVAHENVRKRMASKQLNEFFKNETPASPAAALPVVTFDGVVSFHMNGEEIRGIHVSRAHTDGDTIVHFLASDVIHMGDVYFNGLYPFIDTASGGSVEGTIAACDQVLSVATDKTRIIPGHGPLSNAAELKAYRDMLAAVLAGVKRLLAEGRTPAEIGAAGVSKPYDEKWGKGFLPPARFAEMVAADVLKNR
ncbi:MAG TPA: MBL fold metallo-hydrolase [Usitatibacter sp.]|nr:MBL fold metallo-hydrolase [Usitatibacter sp.]